MGNVSLRDKNKKPKETDETTNTGTNKKNMFESFNSNNLKREEQKTTKKVKLSELKEFEDNVRIIYNDDELELLMESIRDRGLIDEIDVVHIKKGDLYIIADGHRTLRALKNLHGDDWINYEIEVMVRNEFDEYGDEARKYLLEIGFITSNLKQNLTPYEEMEGYEKYIETLNRITGKQLKITNKEVYEKLGISKSKADKYGNIMDKIPKDQWKSLQTAGASYTLLLKVADIVGKVDEPTLEGIMKLISTGEIENKVDIADYIDQREGVQNSINSLDIDEQSKNQIIEKAAKEKFTKEKQEKETLKNSDNIAQKELKKLHTILKNLNASILTISSLPLTETEKTDFQNLKDQFRDVLDTI